jgi:hypothetical protein
MAAEHLYLGDSNMWNTNLGDSTVWNTNIGDSTAWNTNIGDSTMWNTNKVELKQTLNNKFLCKWFEHLRQQAYLGHSTCKNSRFRVLMAANIMTAILGDVHVVYQMVTNVLKENAVCILRIKEMKHNNRWKTLLQNVSNSLLHYTAVHTCRPQN